MSRPAISLALPLTLRVLAGDISHLAFVRCPVSNRFNVVPGEISPAQRLGWLGAIAKLMTTPHAAHAQREVFNQSP